MLNTDFKLCSKLIAVGQHKGKNVTEIILRDSEDLQIHINWKKKKKSKCFGTMSFWSTFGQLNKKGSEHSPCAQSITWICTEVIVEE